MGQRSEALFKKKSSVQRAWGSQDSLVDPEHSRDGGKVAVSERPVPLGGAPGLVPENSWEPLAVYEQNKDVASKGQSGCSEERQTGIGSKGLERCPEATTRSKEKQWVGRWEMPPDRQALRNADGGRASGSRKQLPCLLGSQDLPTHLAPLVHPEYTPAKRS